MNIRTPHLLSPRLSPRLSPCLPLLSPSHAQGTNARGMGIGPSWPVARQCPSPGGKPGAAWQVRGKGLPCPWHPCPWHPGIARHLPCPCPRSTISVSLIVVVKPLPSSTLPTGLYLSTYAPWYARSTLPHPGIARRLAYTRLACPWHCLPLDYTATALALPDFVRTTFCHALSRLAIATPGILPRFLPDYT